MPMDRVRSEEGLREQNQQQAQPPCIRPLEGQMAGGSNQQPPPMPPPPPHRKCPRCDSNNTKFCYYNNYSLLQPRYFCRACRRYWTHGGTLRNVPIGGGSRKGKRPRTAETAGASSSCNEAARAHQSASAPVLPTQNLSVGGQGLRILPPVAPPPVSTNPFFTGGSYLSSSLAAMQSLSSSSGTNPGPAINLGSQFGANMNLLQGISLSPLRPLAPRQFQPQQTTTVFPPQLSFIPPRTMPSWTQGFINTGGSSSSSVAPPLVTFWTQGLINTAPSSSSATPRPSFFNGTTSSSTTGNGNSNDQAGPSSFISDDWTDDLPGFNSSE